LGRKSPRQYTSRKHSSPERKRAWVPYQSHLRRWKKAIPDQQETQCQYSEMASRSRGVYTTKKKVLSHQGIRQGMRGTGRLSSFFHKENMGMECGGARNRGGWRKDDCQGVRFGKHTSICKKTSQRKNRPRGKNLSGEIVE